MADSKLAKPTTISPPPHCAICLGACTNKCYSDSCMHEFCFKCLLEWSKVKAECPLCKQGFKSIIHNIKSIEEYDEHIVESIPVEENRFFDNSSLIYLPPATPPNLQYHFRTTFTVDTHGEHAIQQMLLSHPLLQNFGTFNPERAGHRHYGHGHHRRRRGDTSTLFRRSIYNENLWVYAPPDVTGRYRDVSPSFFRHNPAARTRLVPWLNRELNALLYENTQQVMHVVDVIMEHLLRYHIYSYNFRLLLTTYLGNKVDHFIHEFYNFMRSPFDMIGYDRHVIYPTRPPSPPSNIDLSDNDSDVILLSDNGDTNNNREPQQQVDPVVIDLIETDSDELIIVSEERNGTNSILVDEEEQAEQEEPEQRKPILPLKLRLKHLRHKCKEPQNRRKRKFSTLPITAAESSSSSSDDDISYERYRERKLRKKQKREKKRRRTIDSKSPRSSRDGVVVKSAIFTETCENDVRSADTDEDVRTIYSNNSTIDDHEQAQKHTSGNAHYSRKLDSDTDSDENFYSDLRRNGKSKIKDMRKEGAGPSSSNSEGQSKVSVKKERNGNLWYSRPCVFDSDSSDFE